MSGAKLGQSALNQISRTIEIVARRIVNWELNERMPGFGAQRRYLAKADDDVIKSNTGTFSIYSRGETTDGQDAPKGTEVDTGENIDAYARMGGITADDWVFLEWIDGGWEVYQAECSG